jgi:glycosyltransferase involved in cell wall biosynthesis
MNTMPLCLNIKSTKVDFVIPTRGKVSEVLIRSLSRMSCVGEIIITKERPLSTARKKAVLKASTEWVAMVDDDMILPADWLERVTAEIAPNVGAIATVAVHKNRHVAAYDRVVGNVVQLNKIDTSPHINNVLVRRSLLENYNPPPLFFGEDQYFKKFIESTGHVWKVLPFIGATHLGSSKNYVTIGMAYRRYGHYSAFQLTRRVVARFIFTPFAALITLSLTTFVYLSRLNVQFIAGWAKEFTAEKTENPQ